MLASSLAFARKMVPASTSAAVSSLPKMKPKIKRGTIVTVWTTHDGTYYGKFWSADGWGNVELRDGNWVHEYRITNPPLRTEATFRYAFIRGADAVRVP